MNKKTLGAIVCGVILLVCAACSTAPANKQASAVGNDQATSANALYQLEHSQPIPVFTTSQLRQTLIEIETLESKSTQTTTFFFNMGTQDPTDSCTSVGLPIPVTDQLTNPQQIASARVKDSSGSHYADGVIPQVDPTGIYSQDSTGTNVLCLDKNGSPYLSYWEGFVRTVSGPAHWDFTAHKLVMDGPSAFKFKLTP